MRETQTWLSAFMTVDAFFGQARERWLAGRQERGLDLDAPFQGGDPAQEFLEEVLDASNYLWQMELRNQVSEEVGRRARGMLFELYSMAKMAMEEQTR